MIQNYLQKNNTRLILQSITKRFCIANEADSYIFVNGVEIYKIEAKEKRNYGNSIISSQHLKRLLVDNMKSTGLPGYVYDFSVDYDAIAVDDILDIHKYLME